MKDELRLGSAVYSRLYECGQVYIGQTGRSIKTRIKEHYQHIPLGYPDISAVAERRFNHNHLTKFQESRILSIVSGYMGRLIWEATELELRTKSTDREDSLTSSGSYKPIFLLVRDNSQPSQPF